MTKEKLKELLDAAYLAGWATTGEGYNGEYTGRGLDCEAPDTNPEWCRTRDEDLAKVIEQSKPKKVKSK